MSKKIITYTVMGLMLLGALLWAIPPSVFAPSPAKEPVTTTSSTSSVMLSTTTTEENSSQDKYQKLINHLTMKNTVLMAIAFKGFRDEEYLQPKKVLEQAGFSVNTTSTKMGMAEGTYGTTVVIDTDINKVDPNDYLALVFSGGEGMEKELDNPQFQKLAQDFVKAGKPVAAICIAPALLAKAGLLQGKKAAVWSSPLYKKSIKILKANGAIYEDKPVVRDGNIITANGPAAAQQFGEAIVNLLNKK